MDPTATNTTIYVGRYRYFFQVAAITPAGVGQFTELKNITVTPNIPASPTDLTATGNSQDRTAHLEWKKPDSKVKLYYIYYAWPYSDDTVIGDVKCCNTTLTETTVKDLSPNVTYIFKVTAFNDDGESLQSDPASVTIVGDPLPRPTNLNATPTGFHTIELTWSIDDTSHNWMYGIYYSKSGHYLTEPKEIVNDTKATVPGLESDVLYIFQVGVVGPVGKGPQSIPCVGATQFDPSLQPRDIRARAVDFTTIEVTWRSPRDLPTKLKYKIYYGIPKAGQIEFQAVNVPDTKDTSLAYNITGLIPGAPYTIKLSNGEMTAAMIAKEVNVTTLSSSAPTSLKVFELPRADNDIVGVTLEWTAPDRILNKSLGYAVFMAIGDKPVSWKHQTSSDINVTAIVGLEKNVTYNFKVCTDQYMNYYGEFSDVAQVTLSDTAGSDPHTAHHKKSSKMAAIVAPIIGVVAMLAVALVIFIVRHHRLQRSFTQFANSHYDSRSGTTTFSVEGDGLGEEEDSPMIRGFSDDEPLVVA
ncbi:sortilin-related receptor-like [Ptychodera flava]|uniref:sortilin-related receptor-like n=1 Tax=Ptychodera flava TaxID=63121 RepID=UPI00396A5A7B